jgi:hypothetical protein
VPGGPGQFAPQQQWPTPAPPKKDGAGKWIAGVVALVAVVAVTAVVAVSCTKNTGGNAGGGGGSAAGNNSGIASANDTGPVGIIIEDPSCAPWVPITTTLTHVASNGWDKRDPSIAETNWTPEQRTQYQAVEQAYRSAADQTVPLAKLTTHRVMRELYMQFIAYARAYAESIPTYTAADDTINGVATSSIAVLNGICGAITYGSAAARAPLVTAAAPPTSVAQVGEPSNPSRLTLSAGICAGWQSATSELNSDPAFVAWTKQDSNIPASSWTDEYKAENQAVAPVLNRFADIYEKLGRQSSNPFIEDIGVLSAQYLRAVVMAIPTYTQADSYLYDVFAKTAPIVKSACAAAKVN